MINKKGIRNLILEDINISLVLCEDTISADNVFCEYTNEYKFFSSEAEKFIDKNFEEQSNKRLTDGVIYGLKSFEIYGSKIFLGYEKGDYKTYLATINKDYKRYIEENNFFLVPIRILGIIITRDNKIITTGKTELCDYSRLISSFVISDDIFDEQINILHTITREVTEEIGEIALSNSAIIGVVLRRCCNFITRHNVNYTSNEILEIRKKNNSKDGCKMNSMIFIDNNIASIKKAILDSDLGLAGKEALKFHLKRSFNNYEIYK